MGNLTFGGTGKTPFVIWLCGRLQALGFSPGILSRGYRAEGAEGNDEARVIARHLTGVPHVQNPDRHAGGMTIADVVDCYVLDDGFQHHPLARDIDFVLVDATDPFGGGLCPPGGRLREPLSSLARADLVVLTRADLAGPDELGAAMRRVRELTAAPVVTARFAPSWAGAAAAGEVLAACGIGNPGAFVATVESMGVTVARRRFYRDHHHYTAADAEALAAGGLPVVVTEKDAVKLEPLWKGPAPLHVIRIAFEPLDGGHAIESVLERLRASAGGPGASDA